MLALAETDWLAALAGLAAGVALGVVARQRRFCALGALERWWYAGDAAGMRAWAFAAAVAIAITQAMIFAGVIDLAGTFQLAPSLSLPGAVLGGVMFGFGMALVGACGFSALVQLGGGSLRALVALVALGLAALATQRGLLAQARVATFDAQASDLSFAGDQSMGALVSALAGIDLRAAVATAVAAALIGWAWRGRVGRFDAASTGAAVGTVIAFGWLATSFAAGHGFAPVQLEAGSFVVPVGDALMHLAANTGVPPDYGVGMVIGVPIGAALVAWRRHDVRWEACDDARELGRHLGGAALMGVGGVLAMGCTVGQGLTALSVLAVSAPVVIASIMLGARLGLAWMIEGSVRNAFTRTGRATAEAPGQPVTKR